MRARTNTPLCHSVEPFEHITSVLLCTGEACTLRFAGQRLTSFDHLALVAEAHTRNIERAEPLGLGPQLAPSHCNTPKSFSLHAWIPWPLLHTQIRASGRQLRVDGPGCDCGIRQLGSAGCMAPQSTAILVGRDWSTNEGTSPLRHNLWKVST